MNNYQQINQNAQAHVSKLRNEAQNHNLVQQASENTSENISAAKKGNTMPQIKFNTLVSRAILVTVIITGLLAVGFRSNNQAVAVFPQIKSFITQIQVPQFQAFGPEITETFTAIAPNQDMFIASEDVIDMFTVEDKATLKDHFIASAHTMPEMFIDIVAASSNEQNMFIGQSSPSFTTMASIPAFTNA